MSTNRAVPARAGGAGAARYRFEFDFDRRFRPLFLLVGVSPGRSHVDLTDDELSVTFGPWSMRTSRDNIVGAEVGGPFRVPFALGVRYSLADGGVTFGTNARRGVCVRLRRPVAAIEPFGLLRHPGVTLTVAEPDELAEVLNRAPGRRGR